MLGPDPSPEPHCPPPPALLALTSSWGCSVSVQNADPRVRALPPAPPICRLGAALTEDRIDSPGHREMPVLCLPRQGRPSAHPHLRKGTGNPCTKSGAKPAPRCPGKGAVLRDRDTGGASGPGFGSKEPQGQLLAAPSGRRRTGNRSDPLPSVQGLPPSPCQPPAGTVRLPAPSARGTASLCRRGWDRAARGHRGLRKPWPFRGGL